MAGQHGLQTEWNEIIRGLDNLHQVGSALQVQTFILRSQFCGNPQPAIRTAGAALPPTIREAN